MANAEIVHQMSENPAGGGYVGDDEGGGRRRSRRHKGGSQKRKLEKAQEHLRSRMRQRLNGPSMVTSRVQKASTGVGDGGNLQICQDRKVEEVLSPRAKTFKGSKADKNGDAKNQLTGNYWRTQQERYSNITHPRGAGKRSGSQEDVPLHELVDRVLQRKDQTTTNMAPLTIRSYKQPKAPFAIQQHPMIRKMVAGQAVTTLRKHPKDKGPYFVVLQRENPLINNLERKQEGVVQRNPPNGSTELEINTWRPELEKNEKRHDSLIDEDRGVTNYKLQMQHAAKLAEARFDFSNSSKMSKMQTFDALPPIKVSQVEKDSKFTSLSSNTSNENHSIGFSSEAESDQEKVQSTNNRSRSSDAILQTMQAYKRSRRQASENDFKTILRTRHRFTAKTKQFKDELTKARALSVIDEDQSSVSSERSTCLSGRRTSQSSLRNLSARSLNKIEETKTPEPDDTDIQNAKAKQKATVVDRRTHVIEEDDEESVGEDDSVIRKESSIPLGSRIGNDDSVTLFQGEGQDSGRLPLQLSSSNPLPPIKVMSPTNHERKRENSPNTSQITDQETLSTNPVLPEIESSCHVGSQDKDHISADLPCNISGTSTANPNEMVETH